MPTSGIETEKEDCKNLNLEGESFAFEPTTHAVVLKLSEGLNPSKSAGLFNLVDKFRKEGASILASPLTNLCNLSISVSSLPDECKAAKLKPLYKKEAKTKPKKLQTHFFTSFDLKNVKNNSKNNSLSNPKFLG